MFWGDPQCPADYGVTEQVLWSRLWLLQLLSRLEAPFKCLPVFVVLLVSCVVGRGLSCGFLKLSHLVGVAYGIQVHATATVEGSAHGIPDVLLGGCSAKAVGAR